jgi:hypothetical protein
VAAYLRRSSPPPAGEKPIIAIFEGDTWFHILVGEDILKTQTFPTTDSYSFSAYGNECMAFEWLGQILMALTVVGGLRALTALMAGLMSALLLGLHRCPTPAACFDQLTVKVSATVWLSVAEPEPVLPVTVNV